MELKIKGADFSAITIGKIIVLPDQISQEVETLIGYYVNSNISADSIKAKALEWLYQQLGGNEQNSLWSRMKYLFIPAMANDVRDCYYDLKGNGTIYSETPNWCTSTNVELNSFGAKPKESLARGFVPMYSDIINPSTMINETVFGFTYNKSTTIKTFAPINTQGLSSGDSANIYVYNGLLRYGIIKPDGTPEIIDVLDLENVTGLLAIIYGQSGDNVRYFVNNNINEGEVIGETTIPAVYKPQAFTGKAGDNVLFPQKETAICGKMDAISNAEADFLNRTFESFMSLLV